MNNRCNLFFNLCHLSYYFSLFFDNKISGEIREKNSNNTGATCAIFSPVKERL